MTIEHWMTSDSYCWRNMRWEKKGEGGEREGDILIVVEHLLKIRNWRIGFENMRSDLKI